jgi:hypothetical protein
MLDTSLSAASHEDLFSAGHISDLPEPADLEGLQRWFAAMVHAHHTYTPLVHYTLAQYCDLTTG